MDTTQKIKNLIQKAETDEETKELMEEFFEKIKGESHYDKIIDLFEIANNHKPNTQQQHILYLQLL